MIKKGQVYKHFKGNKYKIIAIAYDSETTKEVVVYQSLADDKVWVRDYEMFISKVDKEKYPLCQQEYRFELVND